eukprot:scaffold291765_cov35-Tisochrysis_lutea.AAC.1
MYGLAEWLHLLFRLRITHAMWTHLASCLHTSRSRMCGTLPCGEGDLAMWPCVRRRVTGTLLDMCPCAKNMNASLTWDCSRCPRVHIIRAVK